MVTIVFHAAKWGMIEATGPAHLTRSEMHYTNVLRSES